MEHPILTLLRRAVPDQYAASVDKNSFDGRYSRDSVIVTLSIALGLYNSIEMVLLISTTFKKKRGLYFWSLAVCNNGVILYNLGILLSYFELGPILFARIILDIGWFLMVVFQSVVLYSRLGLIVDNEKIVRAVKWMIVFDSVVVCVTTIVLDFGNNYSGLRSFTIGYYYIERIQMTMLTLQELIISGIYVWKTLALLKVISKDSMRTMMWQLFTLNVLIISMDIALVCLEFLHFQLYQECIKGFVYSVKLKLELNILSKLILLVRDNASARSMTLDIINSDTAAGQAQAELHFEMSSADPRFRNPSAQDEKKTMANVEEGSHFGPSRSSSSNQQVDDDDDDGIGRVLSNQSRTTARTSGRESDMLYAEMLRSMTR